MPNLGRRVHFRKWCFETIIATKGYTIEKINPSEDNPSQQQGKAGFLFTDLKPLIYRPELSIYSLWKIVPTYEIL